MATTNLLLIIISAASLFTMVDAVVQEEPNQQKSMYCDIDKEKLRRLWYLGTVRGLIKMKARAVLDEISWIEKSIYQQCEKSAKSTVDLAKCAVRVFDNRDYNIKREEELRSKQKPVVNISIRKSATYQQTIPFSTDYNTTEAISRPNVLPYSTLQQKKMYNKTAKHYYYKSGYGWVKDPIRAQTRLRRFRRDNIDEAWDIFLKEEREKQKKNRIRAAGIVTKRIEEQLERNILGMERIQTNKRNKRKVSEEPIVPIANSKPALDYSKIAMSYLKNFVGGKPAGFPNIEKLRQIREYVDKADTVKAYFKLINDENKGIMKKFGIMSEDPQVQKDAADVLADVIEAVNNFAAKHQHSDLFPDGKLSIMSPRLFSIMPDKKEKNRLLSPTVFSFQDDGFFSVPELLDIVTSDKSYQQNMLEMILEVSGGSAALDKALESMKAIMNDLEKVHYPLMQELSKHDHNWIKAKRSFTDEQNEEFDKFGFTYLNKDQMDLMFSNKKFTRSQQMNTTALGSMSRKEKEQWIEQKIRQISSFGRTEWPFWNNRVKRQAGHGGGDANGHETPHTGVEWDTLMPIAFTNFVNQGSSLEVVTLSPRAFIGEIINPEALTVHTLSPRAFVATVLSPSALVARILSPGAFRAEVLSPRALQAWVLIPEAFITEVLTPHFLEPKILSPEALIIFVLSPKFLSPHVLSGEAVGVVVLSPHILSPRIASEEKLLVEVLSPHILGGSHSHEEAHHDILEVGSHSEHSDAGHPNEPHDENGHAILTPRNEADHAAENSLNHFLHSPNHPLRK